MDYVYAAMWLSVGLILIFVWERKTGCFMLPEDFS